MSNDLSAVTPKIIAAAVPVLRENSVMPRLVNTDISDDAKKRGNTVDVPIPSEFVVTDVVPSTNPSITTPQDLTPTTVPVSLNRWKHVPFGLSDKEILEIVDNNIIPEEMKACVKAIVNDVDQYLLSKYVEFYGFHGTPGTTPFEDEKPIDAAQIRKVLNNQLAPLEPRHVVFDADAEANALAVPAFSNAEWHGDPEAIIKGKLNMRLGFSWWMDQNVQTHTAGTMASRVTSGVTALGATTVLVTGGSGDPVVGDIITFANHTQSYVVTGDIVAGTSFSVRPPLQVAVPDANAITPLGDHVANIAFHPQAFAFATRPLQQVQAGLGVITEVVVDDISGLAIRLQVKYGNYMTVWSFDILYGGEVVRPELGARLVG